MWIHEISGTQLMNLGKDYRICYNCFIDNSYKESGNYEKRQQLLITNKSFDLFKHETDYNLTTFNQ